MTPNTIDEYLEQLRDVMRDDDPALRQDALYDAEEYLRAELAQNAGRPIREVIAEIVSGYGAPAEVAAAYRATEHTVAEALRAPARTAARSGLGHVFGVMTDPRTYASMFYMLLALASGIVYFTVVVTGLSMSLGLVITIIGIPFFLLFIALVRVLSLVEGRLVEAMLGVRMPRRPVYRSADDSILARIGRMLTDGRTWSTMLYMLIQLPLGIAYFTFVVTGLALSLALLVAPLGVLLGADVVIFNGELSLWLYPFVSLLGLVALLVTLHVSRWVGGVHGALAKYLLVRI